MRGVIRRTGRAAALLALLTLVVAQGAVAADRDGGRDRTFIEQLKRAKHWIVTVFDQIGLPPG